jgi:glucose 1-dehydrogenase
LIKPAIGKKALVTGGSRGIGRGIAYALAAEGYDLAISHWNDHMHAHQAQEHIASTYGRGCSVFHGNLEEEAEPALLVDEAVKALGRIDLLVNNAGITIFNDILEMDIEHMNRLLHLNLRAPLLMMRYVGLHMAETGNKGNIINITSTRAERAYPSDAVYGGVKAALTRATQSIALEYSVYGIRVNCIAPGAISTTEERADYFRELGRKIPLGRPGFPEDIGQAVVWLASDHASYMTGSTIRLDGGLILPGMPETVSVEGDKGWRE